MSPLRGYDALSSIFSIKISHLRCFLLFYEISTILIQTLEMKMIFIESDLFPELAAQNRIFTVPTIVVYFAGRETVRKSRAFGVDELKSLIQRPYALLFD